MYSRTSMVDWHLIDWWLVKLTDWCLVDWWLVTGGLRLYQILSTQRCHLDGSYLGSIAIWGGAPISKELSYNPSRVDKFFTISFSTFFCLANVCCVHSLEWPWWGDSNEYTQHTFIIKNTEKISHNYRHYASGYGTNSNPPWLKIPLSWTNFHGPKGVRAIEVRL